MNKGSMMKRIAVLSAVLALTAFSRAQADPKILYQSDFSKVDAGQVPAEFLVLDGDFAVREENGKKVLELPGAPVDAYGVLFGSSTNSGVTVSAKIFGTKKGRREPSFGVGLNGVSGYKLKVSPGKNALEIFKGDESAASIPYQWKSGAWTIFRLQVRQAAPDDWKVEGKAWAQGDAEPKDWMIALDEKTPPHDGRPSIWGSPFSGTPIQFDDLTVTTK
jgi:hypothetical protein